MVGQQNVTMAVGEGEKDWRSVRRFMINNGNEQYEWIEPNRTQFLFYIQ